MQKPVEPSIECAVACLVALCEIIPRQLDGMNLNCFVERRGFFSIARGVLLVWVMKLLWHKARGFGLAAAWGVYRFKNGFFRSLTTSATSKTLKSNTVQGLASPGVGVGFKENIDKAALVGGDRKGDFASIDIERFGNGAVELDFCCENRIAVER